MIPEGANLQDEASDKFWSGYSIESWRGFVAHDWGVPSREDTYRLIREYVANKYGATFCEVGFGGAYDFKTCFAPLEKEGKIKYTGFDRTAYFVKYANIDFPKHDFRVGEFKDLKPKEFDIVYTRHVMQHQSPDTYRDCVRKFVGAAKELAVICWHPPLGQSHFHYVDGWVNTFDKDLVDGIIRGNGFEILEYPSGEDCICLCRRTS